MVYTNKGENLIKPKTVQMGPDGEVSSGTILIYNQKKNNFYAQLENFVQYVPQSSTLKKVNRFVEQRINFQL
jgi:hypothetical protein